MPDEFDEFVAAVESGLRRALVAAYGVEVGREAACDALVWAWETWPRVQRYRNPGGYLFRVGQTAARKELRRRQKRSDVALTVSAEQPRVMAEPGLDAAIHTLSVRQRTAVILVHGYGYTLAETAAAMRCSTSSVRNHVKRALTKLRQSLGAEVDD